MTRTTTTRFLPLLVGLFLLLAIALPARAQTAPAWAQDALYPFAKPEWI